MERRSEVTKIKLDQVCSKLTRNGFATSGCDDLWLKYSGVLTLQFAVAHVVRFHVFGILVVNVTSQVDGAWFVCVSYGISLLKRKRGKPGGNLIFRFLSSPAYEKLSYR